MQGRAAWRRSLWSKLKVLRQLRTLYARYKAEYAAEWEAGQAHHSHAPALPRPRLLPGPAVVASPPRRRLPRPPRPAPDYQDYITDYYDDYSDYYTDPGPGLPACNTGCQVARLVRALKTNKRKKGKQLNDNFESLGKIVDYEDFETTIEKESSL